MRHRTRRRIHTVIKIAQQSIQISVTILLIHRYVDDRIQTGREINEDVAYHVYHGILHVLVEYFHQCYRQIAHQETQEDQENHFRYMHFTTFYVTSALVFLHPLPALADYPIDSGVTHDYHNAG